MKIGINKERPDATPFEEASGLVYQVSENVDDWHFKSRRGTAGCRTH
ncbi:hypothetical protein E6C60_3781 [Paenibacillus algicola]|uniref:Uncharacterized protein n=1 Tax=Paenibacillus algicola TaxID=2565926 RepID=A0A4P8XNM8_9BACL|nr:hypothetical protein E6C60_3781 [Paenibacillus algicola]